MVLECNLQNTLKIILIFGLILCIEYLLIIFCSTLVNIKYRAAFFFISSILMLITLIILFYFASKILFALMMLVLVFATLDDFFGNEDKK